MTNKSFLMSTAIKKLKEGKTVKIDDNLMSTHFKARRNGTEVWMHYPGLTWTKYGTLKEFSSEHHAYATGKRYFADRRFVVVQGR